MRLIPPIVITLPLFPIVNRLGLNDTHLVLILLYATFFVSLGTMLMRTFIDQIPRELDEAAMIDGAEPAHRSCARVILPLARQGMLAVAVFVIVFAWNEFLFAFIFTADPRQDRAARDRRDDRLARRRRLGRAVRRGDGAAAAGPAVRDRSCKSTWSPA